MQTVTVKIYNPDYDYSDENCEDTITTTYTDVVSFQFGGQYLQMLFEDGSSKVVKDVLEADILPDAAPPSTE